MVAYSFKQRFAQPILDGMKLHTIRADRQRHARPGEEMQLYTGMRTRQCRLIARVICTEILPILIDLSEQEVIISGDGSAISGWPWPVKDWSKMAGDDFVIHGMLLTRFNGGVETLARNDGFASWDAMREFWIEEHGAPPDDEHVFVGKLIGWWPQ